MSHITKVDIEIRDLNALETAAAACGLVMHRGQKTYHWFGRSVGDYPLPDGIKESDLGKCTHALSIAGNSEAYEIGIVEQADGTFTLLWDFWQGGYGLQARVGAGAEKLIGAYTIEAAANAATAQGFQTMRMEDGSLLILHPDGGTLTVLADGTVDAAGFVGTGCSKAAASIEQALGRTRETQYKDSYFAERARVQNG